jgi:hypothetical protein
MSSPGQLRGEDMRLKHLIPTEQINQLHDLYADFFEEIRLNTLNYTNFITLDQLENN